jgi:peptidoglycan/LPS O-acetylase OafA/YrhL
LVETNCVRTANTHPARNHALDGLRGLAALSVVLGHCYLTITGLALWSTSLRDYPGMSGSDIAKRIVSSLFPSDAAVMVFFVLSGHVLWLSFERKKMRFPAGGPDYILARLFRLLPLTIVTALPFGWIEGAGIAGIAANMFLLSTSLNGVLWSLQAEIADSMVLFLAWGLVRGDRRRLALLLVLSFAVTPFCRGIGPIVFFPAFLLGAAVSAIPPRLCRTGWVVIPAILVLLLANVAMGHGGIARPFEMLSATILVAAVHNGTLPFLASRIPLFLGGISYPLYLIHLLAIRGAESILGNTAAMPVLPSFLALAGATCILAMPVAWLLHIGIEEPALRWRPRAA